MDALFYGFTVLLFAAVILMIEAQINYALQGVQLILDENLKTLEVRAEVTMIVSKGNNPLKFSPDVGFALSQLLAPQGRGFMRLPYACRRWSQSVMIQTGGRP